MSVNALKRVNTKISLSQLYITKTFIIKIICTRDLRRHHFYVQPKLNIFNFEEIVFCLLTDSVVIDVFDRHYIVFAIPVLLCCQVLL